MPGENFHPGTVSGDTFRYAALAPEWRPVPGVDSVHADVLTAGLPGEQIAHYTPFSLRIADHGHFQSQVLLGRLLLAAEVDTAL
ncbi:hypothetical protein D3C85_1296130 [compost metagenome]